MTVEIDLNADLGEGFDDAAILPYLTSCSVACGAHAGDRATMAATMKEAGRLGVACGAHPGYPDRENFGRRELALTLGELEETVRSQLSEAAAAARSAGISLSHVKPHGALYHACNRRRDIARTVARVVASLSRPVMLVGFAGSILLEEGASAGLETAAEAFADRRYLADGSLMPRGDPRAVVSNPAGAASQAIAIVRDRAVTAADGTRISIEARTICLHGDTPGAVENARAVREALERAGVAIRRLERPSA